MVRRSGARAAVCVLELPYSKQFTPTQIRSLHQFVVLVHDLGPDSGGTLQAARQQILLQLFTSAPRAGTDRKQDTRVGNALTSLEHWGVRGSTGHLTSLGKTIRRSADDAEAARHLVEHYLRNLGGAQTAKTLLEVVQSGGSGRPLKKDEIAKALLRARIYENPDGTDHAAVLAWLAHNGVAVAVREGRGRWRLDEKRFLELSGVTPAQVQQVAATDPVQRALLVELARSPNGRSESGTMQRLLASRADLEVDVPRFGPRYLNPLRDAGLLTILSKSGRQGAQKFEITDLGRSEAVTDLVARWEAGGAAAGHQREDLVRPLPDIIADLDASTQPDRGRRGIALEQFALRLFDRLGLQGVRWRERRDQAEEIDGTAQALRPSFALWQMQAKNTASLNADDAAKEIGLAVTNGAAVVLLITTGKFTEPARSVIARTEQRSSLTVVCLNGEDVQRLARNPTVLLALMQREAERSRANRTT